MGCGRRVRCKGMGPPACWVLLMGWGQARGGVCVCAQPCCGFAAPWDPRGDSPLCNTAATPEQDLERPCRSEEEVGPRSFQGVPSPVGHGVMIRVLGGGGGTGGGGGHQRGSGCWWGGCGLIGKSSFLESRW